MKLTSPRVLVVSAYGRGHWMAVEMQRLGFNVQLVDVTKHIGGSNVEDQEGPFGILQSSHWHKQELEALKSFGPLKELEQGFVFWLQNGPWELRGPNSDYRSEVLKQAERTIHFVKHYSEPNTDRRAWVAKLEELDFDRRWFASAACDVLSNRSQWANEAFSKSTPAALYDHFWYRYPEAWSVDASLRWCEEQGVVITKDAEIPDLAIENRILQGLEVKAEKSGFVRCHHLIWQLTSLETSFLSPRAFLKLFKGKALTPEWCWLRYKLEFAESRELHQLPDQFLKINEITEPWAHDNYAIFKRGQNKNTYHVWLRLPFSQRFEREYLQDRIRPVQDQLLARCGRLQTTKVELPQEALLSSQQVGETLYPLYRAQDLIHPLGVQLKNLWFSSSEDWPSYAWTSIFDQQKKIIYSLQKWWGELSPEQREKELDL